MELGLSLGDGLCMGDQKKEVRTAGLKVGFDVGLGLGFGRSEEEEEDDEDEESGGNDEGNESGNYWETRSSPETPMAPVQLNLLPPAPITRQLGFPWPSSGSGGF